MSRILVACVCILSSALAFAFEFSSDQQTQAKRLIQQAEEDNVGYDLVSSLTTEVGPRLAGTDAEARARAWAKEKFKTLGFKNIREEPFDVPVWLRGIETASVVSPYPQALTVTALGGSRATPKKGVTGEVVMFSTLQDLKNVADKSLKGKIVFVDEVMARTQDGSGYVAAVRKRSEASLEAYRAGAKAALIRSVGTSSHRFAHTGQMKRIYDPLLMKSVPAAALSAPDADQLKRMFATTDKITIKLTLTPKVEPASRSGNVIAEIPGSSLSEEIVLLGAHLDSWDLGTGAIDDGAGVGIVMAAANLIAKSIKKPLKRTIRVVLFGSEEVGLIGAENYTKQHADELSKHVALAESDFGADVIWRLGSKNVAEDKLPVVKALQHIVRPLGIIPGDNNAYGGPDLKFMKDKGVPVIELKQDGTDYFDLHHTANDTLDKINKEKLRQNIAAYAAFAYLMADTEERLKPQ